MESSSKFYLLVFILAFIGNFIVEIIVTQIPIVVYNVEPMLLKISWFTFVLYIPWIATTYFVGNWLNRKTKMTKYIFYFIIGALFAFAVDQIATNYSWYYYVFPSVFLIGQVPFEDFFAVGAMITASVSIASYIAGKVFKNK